MVDPPTDKIDDGHTGKNGLRKNLRNIRQNIDFNDIKISIEKIIELLRLIETSVCVAGYAAIHGEPEVLHILVSSQNHGKITALPAISGREGQMIFRRWSPGSRLAKSILGFDQPDETGSECDPDLILTPLLGFDRQFNRLGQGGGHYDRAFVKYPNAIRIGIAWSVQEIEQVPVDPWDITLDAILTEREWIRPEFGRIQAFLGA
jgi:5-formyltetrahydrofolate cyclo-ligase